MYSVLFNIKLTLLIMWDLLVSTEESRVQTLFEVGENVEIASGRKWFPGNVLKTDMRNGVEMVKVEYSTLFQDKKKKIKRLQESVSSDRIRPQPPSEKPEETKSLELMDNVEAYHNDGWCSARRARNMMRDSIPELLALPELKHPIGSDPKPKVTINQDLTAACIKTGPLIIKPEESHWMDHTHLHCLNRLRLTFILEFIVQRLKGLWNLGDIILSENYDRNMMRDSIPELLALPELKHPIGSDPKPKEPLDGSHTSPLSQQVETQMEKEPSNQTHAAQSQIFSTNVTQQVKSSEKLVYTLNFQEPLNESPASPLSQQIETHVYSPNSAQHKQCLEALVHIHDGLPDFLQIEKEQLNEAPDAHTQKEIEPSLDEMPSNPNRGEENLDDERGGKRHKGK
uniref:Agenet-like domain-containing protein n=1 Tax=Brassica oleracea var. oleracea TaxID=109376 RepID=A0A0D3DMG8_BRAOL